MTERPVGVTDLASGAGVADVRTRERSVGGNTVAEQYVIPISERVPSYKGFAASFRAPGRAAVAQNLFAIFNASASVLVGVRRLSVQMDATAALATVAKAIKSSRITTVPTNGTSIAKGVFDSALTSDAGVTLFGDASADGTSSATTLTSTAGTFAWAQLVMRLHTAVGQVLMDDESLIPQLCEDDPVILRQNQGILVSIVAASTATNPATDFHVVNCMWEEFTLP